MIPPKFPHRVIFNVKSFMIRLVNLKGLFTGMPSDNANMHIINFFGIYTSYNLLWVSWEAMRLRIFPFFLTGKGTLWLGELPHGSISNLNKLQK